MRKLLATTIVVALLTTGAAGAAAVGAPRSAPPVPGVITAHFTDVAPGHPFYSAIEAMASAGITTGYPDGTFRPTEAVTRAAMAAFLYRFMNGPTIPACTAGPRLFTDVPTEHPFCAAIEWLANQDIATGWPDHTFRPTLPMSRQATAAFMFRTFTGDPIPACGAGDRTFTDVPATHPLCGAIEWLENTGLADGWPDGTFRPTVAVSRQATAAMLSRVVI